MTLDWDGFDNQDVTEGGWSTLMARLGELANKHGVISGFVASAGGGTRQVNVAAGAAMLPGVTVDSDAVISKTLAANTSGSDRVDYLVLQADWSANAVTVEVVQGSSATPPALTQVAGSVWQMPLARCVVANNGTTATVTPCAPISRRTRVLEGSVSQGAANPGPTTLGTITVPDPGWPYKLEVVGRVRVQQNTGAKAKLEAVDVDNNSLGSVVSPNLDDVTSVDFSDIRDAVYTDKATTVRLQLSRSSGSGSLTGNAGNSAFYVKQIPA